MFLIDNTLLDSWIHIGSSVAAIREYGNFRTPLRRQPHVLYALFWVHYRCVQAMRESACAPRIVHFFTVYFQRSFLQRVRSVIPISVLVSIFILNVSNCYKGISTFGSLGFDRFSQTHISPLFSPACHCPPSSCLQLRDAYLSHKFLVSLQELLRASFAVGIQNLAGTWIACISAPSFVSMTKFAAYVRQCFSSQHISLVGACVRGRWNCESRQLSADFYNAPAAGGALELAC